MEEARFSPQMTLSYEKTTLANGLRILTAPMPHTYSVSVGIYVGAGSRYERKEEAGLSHFVEHLCFKGSAEAAHRPSDISEAIDSVGGFLNGGTDRELTVYYGKVAAPHFALALDVLADMVSAPLASSPRRWRRSERSSWKSWPWSPTPPARWWTCSSTRPSGPTSPWAGTSLAPRSRCKAINRQMALDYLCRQYVPNNMVVSRSRQRRPRPGGGAGGRLLGRPPAWLPLPLVSRRRRPRPPLRPPLQEDASKPTSAWRCAASPYSTPTAMPSPSCRSSWARA